MSLFHLRSLLWTVLVLGGGVKTGRRIPIWDHSTRLEAPFSLDSKNRSFSSREKETGFEPSLPSFHVTERQRNGMQILLQGFPSSGPSGHLPPGEGPPYAGAVFMAQHPPGGPFFFGKVRRAEFFWQNRNFSFTLRPGYDNLLKHAKCHAAQAPRFGTQPALTRGFSPARYAALGQIK